MSDAPLRTARDKISFNVGTPKAGVVATGKEGVKLGAGVGAKEACEGIGGIGKLAEGKSSGVSDGKGESDMPDPFRVD